MNFTKYHFKTPPINISESNLIKWYTSYTIHNNSVKLTQYFDCIKWNVDTSTSISFTVVHSLKSTHTPTPYYLNPPSLTQSEWLSEHIVLINIRYRRSNASLVLPFLNKSDFSIIGLTETLISRDDSDILAQGLNIFKCKLSTHLLTL